MQNWCPNRCAMFGGVCYRLNQLFDCKHSKFKGNSPPWKVFEVPAWIKDALQYNLYSFFSSKIDTYCQSLLGNILNCYVCQNYIHTHLNVGWMQSNHSANQLLAASLLASHVVSTYATLGTNSSHFFCKNALLLWKVKKLWQQWVWPNGVILEVFRYRLQACYSDFNSLVFM